MNQAGFFYPRKMGRIILQAMEEVTGKGGVERVLTAASLQAWIENYPAPDEERSVSFEAVSQMQAALEEVYGRRGGPGLAQRIGRASFSYGLREYGSLLGLTQAAFRLLPLGTKLHNGARIFADLFNKHTDQHVRIEETEDEILWHIERCPLCWKRKAEAPACHMAVGLLQESLYWLSGGKIFNVQETRCIASGDPACTISIGMIPIS
jgi:predicted hydrocarbon binding protein